MPKVLVIESNQHLLEVIVELVNFEGYEALGTLDGNEAVQLIAEHVPDLIVANITVSGLDTADIFQQIWDSGMRRIPFLLLVASSDRHKLGHSAFMGVNLFHRLPLDTYALMQFVRNHFKNSKPT